MLELLNWLVQFVEYMMYLAGAVVAIGGAAAVFFKIKSAATKPRVQLEERVTAIEKKLTKHDEFFDNDNKKLKTLETDNKLLIKGVVLLISHVVDGNHTAQLEQAQIEMRNYLIER